MVVHINDFFLFSAAFILLGVFIYGAKISSFEIPTTTSSIKLDNRHFSFAFVILAAISAIVASVLFGLDK